MKNNMRYIISIFTVTFFLFCSVFGNSYIIEDAANSFGDRNYIFLFSLVFIFLFWLFIYYQIGRYKITDKHKLIVIAEKGFLGITKIICWIWFIFCFWNITLVFNLGSDSEFSQNILELLVTLQYITTLPFLIYAVYFSIKYPLAVDYIKKALRGVFK
jgi:hypothetical protein